MTGRLMLGAVLACLLAGALAGSAMAHAGLVESDPAEGETVVTPATLRALFDEELDPESSQLVVRNVAGEEVARGGVSDDDELVMTVALPELPPGAYLARWTAVTPDDQGVTRGTISFVVAQPPATDPPEPTATATEPVMTPSATVSPSPTPPAVISPTPSPSPAPSPAPGDGAPAAGFTDVLLAVGLAGAIVGGLIFYLLRRR
jgi:copper resistance protein C